jgi:hypothetical protein
MKSLTILLCIIGWSHITFAQSEKLQAMEQELVFVHNTAKQMWLYIHNSNYDDDDEYSIHTHYSDMIGLLFGQFDKMLNDMLIEDKDMTYPFTELQNSGIYRTHIVWATDSLLRVFSWMLPGGTLHYYGNAIQYKNEKSFVNSFPFENEYNDISYVADASYEYDTVYILKDNNKTIYILSGWTHFSTRIVGYQLIAFSIQDELIEENIFEDENGNITNEISVYYETGCSEIEGGTFPRLIIDENKKTMNFLEIKDDCFTGRSIEYEFDGKKFKNK